MYCNLYYANVIIKTEMLINIKKGGGGSDAKNLY
jgi:hypothetical protein